MENILDLNPATEPVAVVEDVTVVDDVLAQHNAEQVSKQIETFTNEMEIAIEAEEAVTSYETELTTENSSSKLKELQDRLKLTDADLNRHGIAQLTIENAGSFTDKIKEIIKVLFEKAKILYKQIMINVISYLDNSTGKAKKLYEYVSTKCDLMQDMDARNKAGNGPAEELLPLFQTLDSKVLQKLEMFYINSASAFNLTTLYFECVKSGDFTKLEALDNKATFDTSLIVKGAEYSYILSPVGSKVPVLCNLKSGSNTELKIEYVDFKPNTKIKVDTFDRKTILERLKFYYEIGFETSKSSLKKANEYDVRDALKELESEDPVLIEKVQSYGNIITTANMVIMKSMIDTNKALLTLMAYEAKFLKLKDGVSGEPLLITA